MKIHTTVVTIDYVNNNAKFSKSDGSVRLHSRVGKLSSHRLVEILLYKFRVPMPWCGMVIFNWKELD